MAEHETGSYIDVGVKVDKPEHDVGKNVML